MTRGEEAQDAWPEQSKPVDDSRKSGIIKPLEEGSTQSGQLIGSLNKLTQDERAFINELVESGKTVEIIPRSNAINDKTPDFYVDGVKTELKTLNGLSLNAPVKRVSDGFEQGAEVVIIDARKTGLTVKQAEHIITRALGKYGGTLPGSIEIWTMEGIVRR